MNYATNLFPVQKLRLKTKSSGFMFTMLFFFMLMRLLLLETHLLLFMILLQSFDKSSP